MIWKAGILRKGRTGWEVMPILFLFFITPLMADAQMPGQKAPGPPPAQVEQTSHGMHVTAGREILEVTVCTDSVIHVVATPEPSAPASPRPWMLHAQQSCPGAPFKFQPDRTTAITKTLSESSSMSSTAISHSTQSAGDSLLKEGNSVPRTYEPVELNGESTYRVTDRFSPTDQRSALWAGPAPERHVQLSGRHR